MKKNEMEYWYIDHGKTIHETEEIHHSYYIDDPEKKSTITDIYGTPVIEKSAKSWFDVKDIRNMVKTYEVDISQEIKFLHNKWGDDVLTVDMNQFQIGTLDIEVQADNKFPYPEQAEFPINLISLHLSKTNKVTTFGLKPYSGTTSLITDYRYFATEKELLTSFILFFRKARIDILSGWNLRLFDVPYIINRCKVLNLESKEINGRVHRLSLSPVYEYRERSHHAGYHIEGGGYEICGLSILDGLDLYKNFEKEKREFYNLNYIGKLEVGEGKLEFEGSINDLWKRDWNKFVEYNVQDVWLTKKINDTKKYIDLAINFCYQTLIPFEKIFSTLNLVTGYILKILHQNGMVLPDRNKEETEFLPGAYVMAKEGLHKWCMNFDVESMYPSMIRTFNISPETLVLNPKNTTNLIKTPVDGVYYRKDKVGIMAQVVNHIFTERKQYKLLKSICDLKESGVSTEEIAKRLDKPVTKIKQLISGIIGEHGTSKYYDSQQYVRKILSNSLFGNLANKHFSLYSYHNAKVITQGGQSLIKFIAKSTNEYFKKFVNDIVKQTLPQFYKSDIILEKDVCVLVDTDSEYLCFDELIDKFGVTFASNNEFRDWCEKLNKQFLAPFFEKLIDYYFKHFNTNGTVNFVREKIISKMLILAKKKYVIELVDKEGISYDPPVLKYTGIEIVRTDTPMFCRNKLKEITADILGTENKEFILSRLRQIKQEFMTAPISDISSPTGIAGYSEYAQDIEYYKENGLVYKKGCPIHVRAAINYNFIINKHNLPLVPVTNGTKMKFVYLIKNTNELQQNVIGFIGKWPEEFDKLFVVDAELQWEKSFQSIVQRFFDVLKWGEITMVKTALDQIIC